MNFEEKGKEIQNRINWISAKIRDTKFQLHQELTELQKILKEQEAVSYTHLTLPTKRIV